MISSLQQPIQSIQSLSIELEKQLQRLGLIQDEIGFSPELKQQKTAQLLQSAAQFVSSQIDLVNKEKEDIINETESTQKAILSYKGLMGEFASETAVLDPEKSLQKNLDDLKTEQAQVKQRYEERLRRVKELYMQLEGFKESMGEFVDTSMLMTSDIDVSSLAVNAIEEEIQRCEKEYIQRKQTIEKGAEQVFDLLIALGKEPESELEKIVYQFYRESVPIKKMQMCNMLVSEDNMRYIAHRAKKLNEEKEVVEFRKLEISLSLKRLWGRLHIDPQECELFQLANRGFTYKELQKYEDELARLNKLKQERIGDFIQAAREEIKTLWDQLYYSKEQKQSFQNSFETNTLTDEVLESHENEISRLQLEYEDSKCILELVEKHMKLQRELQDFEASTRDPNRLFGKGQRDPGRLLREEKFRRRIGRELPKVTKELEGFLLEYEALKTKPFLVYGKPYFNAIYGDGPKPDAVDHPSHPTKEEHLTAPRTPRRDPPTSRKPMTSPRPNRTKRLFFHTPQPNRVRHINLTSVSSAEPKIDTTQSILHRVRERNIRKQKPIKRGHIFDDDSDEEEDEDENIVPPTLLRQISAPIQKRRKRYGLVETQSESDDNIGLDLGIFDDGPDLSDMSEIDQ